MCHSLATMAGRCWLLAVAGARACSGVCGGAHVPARGAAAALLPARAT